jgi:hypothetical protein
MKIDNLNMPYELAKNKASSEIRVEMDFDTSRWSKRMQNIVCTAIDTGVADCGQDTAWFVKELLRHYDLDTTNISGYWNRDLPLSAIKPEKITEAVSYVSAMLRMKGNDNISYGDERWLKRLSDYGVSELSRDEQRALGWKEMETQGICDLPVPNFSKQDRAIFTMDYLKPQDEQQQIKRAELINLVRSGSLLSISYIINN